jgi:hypothetical protein
MGVRKLTFVFGLFLFWGCTEVIVLDIEQVPPVYIVEGIVTNRNQHHYIRISKTIGFYDEGPTPAISGANVSVKDNQGNEFFYSESDSAGIYFSNEVFEGVPGRVYTLNIDVEGLDFEVLKSNDWQKYRPEVVLIEVLSSSLLEVIESDINQFMASLNYELYAKAVNTIIYRDGSA